MPSGRIHEPSDGGAEPRIQGEVTRGVRVGFRLPHLTASPEPVFFFSVMPTYVYETIPGKPGAAPRRFEFKQSMKDAPLTQDPESGLPVRRVISGGFAPMMAGGGSDASCADGSCALPSPPSHGCGPMCGCAAN